MFQSALRTTRYLRSWLTGRARVDEEELAITRDAVALPATVVKPRGSGGGPLPGWIVLHGMTRPGRRHAQLRRFVRALAASRAVVVVPEIPEWIDLKLSAAATLPTIRAALQLLREIPEADRGRTALVGFSFGAPQAILSAADPSVRGEIAGAVGFGGYCDLERTLRYQLTGVHEWAGTLHRSRPDPYGRWIVGANVLTDVPGYEELDDVAQALWTLAADAGDRQIPARDPSVRHRAARLRETLQPAHRPVFDLFVPPGGDEPEPESVEPLVRGLADAGRRIDPVLDPAKPLESVDGPVHILHGRGDRLIPYTEALRIEQRLGRDGATRTRRGERKDRIRCTVTRLFAHSQEDERPPWGTLLREIVAFAGALAGTLMATEEAASNE